MKFNYYGHSCFSVLIKGKHILFDPFVSHNPLAAKVNVNNIQADYIFLSHGHVDHTADCATIAKRTGAKIVCNWEIHEWLNKQGLENTHPMNTGGKWTFEFGVVKTVVAQHSSGLPDGSYGGNPMGFVFKTDEGNFYYSGDTALTLDMQLIPSFIVPDFSILPIGDNFTMDFKDASRAAQLVNCRRVVGVHYNTFGFIKIDTEEAKTYFSDHGMELILPEIGTTTDI
jgi:L-ascorbate metabolism protein UlaG (beta-lactamase superfamily)